MSATELRFSRSKSALKGAVSVAALVVCIALIYLAVVRHKEPMIIPMMIAAPIAAWGAIRSARRMQTSEPALGCTDEGIRVNAIFGQSALIEFGKIEGVDCDRADRVGYVGGPLGSAGASGEDWHVGDGDFGPRRLASRAGAAFRWALQVTYRDQSGNRRGIRLFDNDVEGGKAALMTFADCIRSNAPEVPQP